MTTVITALAVFGCVFGGALLGMLQGVAQDVPVVLVVQTCEPLKRIVHRAPFAVG